MLENIATQTAVY